MSELLNSFSNEMACRIVSGKFFLKEGRSKVFRDLIIDSSRLLGGFNLEEYFPTLSRIGMLKRAVCAKAERVRNRWTDLLDKQEYDLTRDNMRALLTDVFFAATDTTSNTLEFTLAELMRRPSLMQKLQDEVRSIVPRGQEIVSEIDITNMKYLRAVIKESFRLHPVGPLLAPHLAMTDCNIDGYIVPAGTRVVVNVWAIGRDSASWEDPEEFIPERFEEGGNSENEPQPVVVASWQSAATALQAAEVARQTAALQIAAVQSASHP
uniref:Uncharacterized protein n=1 Tax=Avena sativa TaxID=4498 RepID=A0ACD6AQX2_AVESA